MKIFLSTHGHMASGMMSSIELLYGKTENVTVFDAYVDPDEQVSEHIEAFLQTCSENEVRLLVSDMLGGSVNHDMMQYLGCPNTYIVTGISLPLLLELIVRADEELSADEIDEIVDKARAMTTRIRPLEAPLEEQNLFSEE